MSRNLHLSPSDFFGRLKKLVILIVNLQVLAPLPIGFAVFMVHLATIPITGTGINPARSFGAAVIYNQDKAWDDQVAGVLLNFFSNLSLG